MFGRETELQGELNQKKRMGVVCIAKIEPVRKRYFGQVFLCEIAGIFKGQLLKRKRSYGIIRIRLFRLFCWKMEKDTD